MKWRSTLILLVVVMAILAVVLGRERRRQAGGEARLAEGFLYSHPAKALRWIELSYPEKTLRVERDGEDDPWRLTAPVKDLGDSVVIGRLVATLAVEKPARWLPPVPADSLSAFGLAAPRLTLHLGREDGVDTLAFGDLNAVEKKLWVRTSWRDSLALVSILLRTNSLKGRYELADKRILGGVPTTKLERLEFSNPRGEFSLVPTERGWEVQRPEAYRADDVAVQRLIDMLWGETIVGFAGERETEMGRLGFEHPRATLNVVRRGDTRQHLLELGGSYYELAYARSADREHPFLLDSLTAAPLLESFSAYLSVVLLRFLPGQVLEIVGSDGARAVRDLSEDWLWRDPEGKALNPQEAAVLLNRLMRLPTGRIEALLPRDDQLQDWGLDHPRLALSLRLKEGRRLDVELGRSRDRHTPVRRADYPTVYSVPDSLLYLPWPLAAATNAPGGGQAP